MSFFESPVVRVSRLMFSTAKGGAEKSSSSRPWWRRPLLSGEEFSSLAVQTATIVAALHFLGAYIIHVSVCVGPSMLPTFRASGDLVLIDKVSATQLVGRRYRAGDVVIAWAPYDPDRMVCKRIGAVAGDVVTLHDEEEAVGADEGGRTASAEDNKSRNLLTSSAERSADKSIESAAVTASAPQPVPSPSSSPAVSGDAAANNDDSHRSSADGAGERRHRSSPVQVRVPPGHVWLVGDNPSNSRDSRNYGPVSECLIQGRVVAKIWWPPSLVK